MVGFAVVGPHLAMHHFEEFPHDIVGIKVNAVLYSEAKETVVRTHTLLEPKYNLLEPSVTG